MQPKATSSASAYSGSTREVDDLGVSMAVGVVDDRDATRGGGRADGGVGEVVLQGGYDGGRQRSARVAVAERRQTDLAGVGQPQRCGDPGVGVGVDVLEARADALVGVARQDALECDRTAGRACTSFALRPEA
ncbi:hypothetical protein [Streptomyces sp. NPDC002403]